MVLGARDKYILKFAFDFFFFSNLLKKLPEKRSGLYLKRPVLSDSFLQAQRSLNLPKKPWKRIKKEVNYCAC